MEREPNADFFHPLINVTSTLYTFMYYRVICLFRSLLGFLLF